MLPKINHHLLIGLGEGYNMVCSDAMAMIRETSEFMEIHDKELVVLTKDNVTVMDYEGQCNFTRFLHS